MTISFVVPAFNEEKLLPRALQAIRSAAAAFEERGWEWECIVCDNNSTDRTPQIARELGATVVFEPVNQIARARNAGAAAARGDWLLFIDADSAPTPELLRDAADVMAAGDVVFVGAVVQFDAAVSRSAAFAVGMWNRLSRLLGWMAGSFVLVEAAAFRTVSGFSQTLYAGEEVDLSRRLKRLARRQGRRAAILHRHPLLSSARRMQLYSVREVGGFVLRAVLRPWNTTASRKHCRMWYDGRR
jgi:glycosyltransferase involved in cell wall biosynthesis